jgi:hypothetical protein
MKGEFIKALHKHRQEHYRGLSEGFLWHSTCQDNTIGRMWQVHVSAVMTRRTRFFGGTTVRTLFGGHNENYSPVEYHFNERLVSYSIGFGGVIEKEQY